MEGDFIEAEPWEWMPRVLGGGNQQQLVLWRQAGWLWHGFWPMTYLCLFSPACHLLISQQWNHRSMRHILPFWDILIIINFVCGKSNWWRKEDQTSTAQGAVQTRAQNNSFHPKRMQSLRLLVDTANLSLWQNGVWWGSKETWCASAKGNGHNTYQVFPLSKLIHLYPSSSARLPPQSRKKATHVS